MTRSHPSLMNFLICFLIATLFSGLNGFSIKLIPIDRLDTTIFPKDLTLKERYERISMISQARVRRRLESMTSSDLMDWKGSTELGQNTLKPPIAIDAYGYYYTTVGVGTRPFTPFLLVDTGSAVTWMQCEGCTRCFNITGGNFKRSESRSYRPLPCHHPLCEPRLCVNDSCAYDVRYPGSAYTKGQVGFDTFYFKDGKSPKVFLDTVFDCGLDNNVSGWERRDNKLAGIFGLNLGKRSIFMQYEHETKKRISYCLPSLDAQGTYTFLNFGEDAIIRRGPGVIVHKTRLISNVTKYAVEVVGISLAGKRLPINPAVFRMRPDHTGGFIFDTGSPHTTLVPLAYSIVKKEIIQYFLHIYTWHPAPPQSRAMDLCYNTPIGNFTYPSMTIHFAQADLFLPARNVFQFFNRSFCLMMMPATFEGPSMLGAFQQTNYRFLFDFRAFLVSFVPETCRLF